MFIPSTSHPINFHALLKVLLFIACWSSVVTARSPESGEPLPVTPPSLEMLMDSVVRIDVWAADYSDGTKRIRRGVGSGVIMTGDGHILTNAHVVSPKVERIRVTLANLERVEADFVGWDHWTDLAVIQLDPEMLEEQGWEFTHARFGDSSLLFPGQTVYAVGTPNGLTRTITKGIISNNRRYFEGTLGFGGYETGYFGNWLQTDAAINPGNSGGPLVTESGLVIGINTRSYMGANNLGFAVPQSIAGPVMRGLIENGEISRSYVGIKPGPLQDLESFFNLELNQGVLINNVDVGSPASEKGIRPGDIILEINGEAVDGRFPEQLPPIRRKIAEMPVGSELEFKIKRDEAIMELVLATEELESRVGEEYAFEDWGMSVREVSRAIAREKKLDRVGGVIVVGTRQAFPAQKADLENGDIILKVNRQPLNNLEDLQKIYRQYQESPEQLLLEVSRNHRRSLSVLKPD